MRAALNYRNWKNLERQDFVGSCETSGLARKKGSLALIIIGIIVALAIAFASFYKFSLNRRYVTRKLNKVLLAREFSLSLATLAAHQLRCRNLHETDNLLVKTLATPLAKMPAHSQAKIELASELKDTLAELIAASSELKNLSFSIAWIVNKDDFTPLLAAYASEKKGLVKLLVKISYSPPGFASTIDEEYLYHLPAKVTANLVPVLSRFNLYVKDALAGESPERFNLVSTDKAGNLKSSALKPWVLQNGTAGSLPTRFGEIMKSSSGLVYLGGGTVILGNARGWGTPGELGEGFHLYREGRGPGSSAGGTGMYTVAMLGTTALINYESGLCDDVSDADSQLWYDQIKEGFEKEAKVNSLFRLLGTDQKRSPTLVFGDVYSRTLCCRIFKSSKDAFGALPFAGSQASFDRFKSGDDPKNDISFFISQVGNISRSFYNRNYASRLWDLPYNRALGYIATGYRTPDPVTAGQLPAADDFTDFVSGKAVANKKAQQIPAPYDKIFPALKDLSAMQAILQKIELPGARVAYEIEVAQGETLFKALEREGYLKNGILDINGWAMIKGSGPFTFTGPIELKSHGGLVFAQGDVQIQASISSPSDQFLLNLVSLAGDIIISDKSGVTLNLGLTANGQIRIAGSAGDQALNLKGNLAMKQIAAGTLTTSFCRSFALNYDTRLAALPFDASGQAEKSLLMFSLGWEPALVE